jgi:predicted DNA-binding transcriptional regulator AlpA
MTDTRMMVTLTGEELAQIVMSAVREVLVAHNATVIREPRPSDEMTIGEVVTLFRLSPKSGPKTVWRWRQTLGFPAPRKLGTNRVRWIRAEVDRWRAAREVSGPGAVVTR